MPNDPRDRPPSRFGEPLPDDVSADVAAALSGGAAPRWLLVSCSGDPAAAAERLLAEATAPVECWAAGGADDLDALDAEWTDRRRPALHGQRRADASLSEWIVTVDGLQAAFGVLRRPRSADEPWRLVTVVAADEEDAAVAFGALCGEAAAAGATSLAADVPGPHPALGALARSGWRVDGATLRHAAADDPVDPLRVVPDVAHD
jgi:hypothetical protein